MLLLLSLACAQRTWTPEVKTKGKPTIVAVDPSYLLEARVEDAGFDEVAVLVQVDERARDRVTQSYRHAQVGRYTTESAVEAGNTWMATGAVLGTLGLIGGGYGLSEGEDLEGNPVFNWGAGLGGFLLLGAPILVAGSVQYATPLFPARRKDRRVEQRVTVVDGAQIPWSGGGVLVTTTDGTVLKSGTTGADGSARLVLPIPEVDRVQVRLDGPAGRVDLDLRETQAWLDVRSEQVRELASSGDFQQLSEAADLAGRGSGLWPAYCGGFSEGWANADLERRSNAFSGVGDEAACQQVWLELDAAWAKRLRKAAERGDEGWDAELPVNLARSSSNTPSLRGLARCVALDGVQDPYEVAAQAQEALAAPDVLTASCYTTRLKAAEKDIARLEAEEAARQRTCDNARRAVAKEMPRLTSTAYADVAAYGIRNTRDQMVARMNQMVARGGPTYEEQEWVQCVTYALTDADDMIRGIYQMNYGGYAHEWVEVGRFEWAQEGILRSFTSPGEPCRSFVRRGMGSSALAPADRYLAAVDRLEKACE